MTSFERFSIYFIHDIYVCISRYIGMPYASQSTLQPTLKSVPQPKARGPTICKKLKKKKLDEELSIEFDKHSRPIGQYGREFKSFLGTLVRSHVDINISNWHIVDKDIKDTIWEEIKVSNILIY